MRMILWTALAVIGLDQGVKYWVVVWLGLARQFAIDVWPPYLNFRMAWNQGVNFGLFASDSPEARLMLVAIALAISAGVLLWIGRGRHSAGERLGAGLLIGGALGNAIDRLHYGAVADFLNMSCCGWHNPYSFNIADIAIFLGAAGLVLFGGRKKTP